MQREPIATPDHSGRVLLHYRPGREVGATEGTALDLQVSVVRRGSVRRVQGLLPIANAGAD